MGLIVLGIIILLIGILGAKQSASLHKLRGTIILVGGIVVIGGLIWASARIIQPGYVGVQVLFGKLQEKTLREGFHIVNPFMDIHKMSVKTQNYTMSRTTQEGDVTGDDAIRVLSKDGLEVVIDLTMHYHVIPSEAGIIYRELGMNYRQDLIRPIARSRIRESSVYYNAIELYSTKREEFENQMRDSIRQDLGERGIMVEKILVRNINLPDKIKESIERKLSADQEAQRMEFVLEKERLEAERKRVEAQGNADAQRIVAQALTDKVLQFEMIKVQKELVNSPNSKIILLGTENAPPIFIGK